MSYERILLDTSDYVTTLTLNRPERYNAMDGQFLREFGDCLRELSDDDGTRAIVITGAGRSFCPGMDVELVAQAAADPKGSGMGLGTLDRPFALSQEVPDALRACRKPTIAAINGAVAGMGFSLTCFCDYRIASERATFACGLVKLGLAAELGMTYILPRLIPVQAALEFLSTGEKKDATWAAGCGLVSEVVSPEALMGSARILAAKLAAMPPLGVAMLKQMVYEGLNASYEAQIRTEGYASVMLSQTEDHKEGFLSFLEKRPPVFKGR